ncbi:2Fe-2S iron-sulfur cluster binding domain-containing protein [Steroidobacter sp. S1-65]|uniref:2Fe-2S iron-sulfur cluster binding domain-containing protein n=1 Tax=Steroidobacter gossypii TaxID=2805490 RepID=A0ABS1X0T6_9GAMM|nr:2Fe-2S iron-sulfur cluster-binding protein [Steroidobacter gossypii]MBM0106840.1 2Fe-2S iron-sulfur cluster binding domain-containing protein [Steroidobacter gossypii]
MSEQDDNALLTRRALLEGSAASALLLTTGMPLRSEAAAADEVSFAVHTNVVTLRINAHDSTLNLDSRTTLLDVLRHQLGLTGVKKGCDHGQCGACTVLVNGRRINACLTLAVMHENDEITTIEGLASGERLHPLQSAFIAHDGFQCGYCTPGQICSAAGMLEEARRGWPSHATHNLCAANIPLTDEEIRERMSGNLCRCAAYPNIVKAIAAAAHEARQ